MDGGLAHKANIARKVSSDGFGVEADIIRVLINSGVNLIFFCCSGQSFFVDAL